MTLEVCRVAVHAGRRQADLSLPASTPIMELTPMIADLCGMTPGRDGRAEGTPPAWTLARAGAAPFALTATLSAAGVLDGEVLYLVDASAWRAPVVRDLSDAVADAILTGGPPWRTSGARWLIAGLGMASMASAAAFAALAAPGNAAGGLALGTGATAMASALALRGRPAWRASRLALAVTGWMLAVLGGLVLGGWGTALGVTLASVGLGVVVIASYPVVPVAVPGLVVLATAGAGAGGLMLAGLDGPRALAVLAVLGMLGMRSLPSALGRRLANLARRGARSGMETEAIARLARGLVASLAAGLSGAAFLATAGLIVAGGPYRLGLAAAVALALLLRARSYRFVAEALPPALAGGLLGIGLEVSLASRWLGAAASAGLMALTGLLLAAVALAPSSPRLGRRQARACWLVVDLAQVPLALGALGVFDALASLAHGLHLNLPHQ
jgi:ESX secretion system protein EccD